MPEVSWTRSTRRREDYFDGASPTGSILPWSQHQFKQEAAHFVGTDAPDYLPDFYAWSDKVPGGKVAHVVVGEAKDVLSHSLQLRMLCYALVDQMAEDGLEETLSTLSDYWEFYSTPAPPLNTLLAYSETEANYQGVIGRPSPYIDQD